MPLAALWLACSSGEDPPKPEPPATVERLSPVEHLNRASVALRGYRASVEELQLVARDPDQLPALVDGYLAAPELGDTIRDLHNDALLLDLEAGKYVYPPIGPLAGATFADMRSLMQEPLRLIEHVVMTDRPYTEIVTADYTMANGATAAAFGLPHAGPPEAWEPAVWPDGRPAAGILSSTILYQRYVSAGSNFNRGRANMVSRALLCHDYLDSDVILDTNVNLADPDIVADAVVKNPSCAACHQTLDPLASYFFTFAPKEYPNAVKKLPFSVYKPAGADAWITTNKRPPMYFGASASGVHGLGAIIASDPRFARCAAQRFASFLTQVPIARLDPAFVARLQRDFVAGGYNARALARSVVLSDEFRVSHATADGDPEAVVGMLKMRPRQLAASLYRLTGFRWIVETGGKLSGVPLGPVDLLDNDTVGYRVLGGGIDSYYVTAVQTTTGATTALVNRRAALAAADAVVEHDRTAPVAERRLFVKADVTAADEVAVRAELAYLLARIHGELVESSDPRVDDALALFRDAHAASGDASRAWKLTLGALLSDVRAIYY